MFDISNAWSEKTKQAFIETFDRQTKTKHWQMQQFRLLIITQFFPPDYAATGQLIHELAHQLDEKKIKVKVFTGQPGYAFRQQKAPIREKFNNFVVQRSSFKQFCSKRIRSKTINGVIFALTGAWHLLKNARQHDAVILTTAPPFLAIIGYLANLIFKLDYVCLVYDIYPDIIVRLGVISNKNLLSRLWHKVNHLVWQRSEKIIVLSDTMKQTIVARHPAIADKISVIHNWADPNWIEPLPKADNWFAHQHQTKDKFTVLYSGNLGHCHDLDTILNAAKLLKHEPIQFVFIGEGAKHLHCLSIVEEFELNNCRFLPFQERANLPYSLTACDLALVSIAPGLEGTIAPSKVYGIMAAGKAIAAVCEPHSYLRQLIADANCGAAFNNNHSELLAEFILTLAADAILASKMGNAGRNYLKNHFTPEIIAKQYFQALGIEMELENSKLNTKISIPKITIIK